MPIFRKTIHAKFFDENGGRIALDSLILPSQAILRPMKGDIISSKNGDKYEVALCEIVVTDDGQWISYTLKDLTSGTKALNL